MKCWQIKCTVLSRNYLSECNQEFYLNVCGGREKNLIFKLYRRKVFLRSCICADMFENQRWVTENITHLLPNLNKTFFQFYFKLFFCILLVVHEIIPVALQPTLNFPEIMNENIWMDEYFAARMFFGLFVFKVTQPYRLVTTFGQCVCL